MPVDPAPLSGSSTSVTLPHHQDSLGSTHFFRSNEDLTPDNRSSGSLYCRICHVDPAPLSGSTTSVTLPHHQDSLGSTHFFRSNEDLTPDNRSSGSLYCRICHEGSSHEELIDPCECAGTVALIHTSCLEKWLSTSNTDRCEICKHRFYIQRKNKTIFKSLWHWWKSRSVHGTRGITSDVICLVVLTPLCVASTYLCGVGASAYTKLGFWEGTGLAVLCCMLVATYSLWLIVTFRYHCTSWKNWRRRNQDIKLLVKHRSEEINNPKLMMKIQQDRNNNRSIMVEMPPRMYGLAAWFGMNFNHSHDPSYALHETSFV